MTPLGRTLRHLYATSGHTSLTEWCQCVGVSYGTIRHWMRTETEPTWLRTLRTIKRRTGLTWGELLDGHAWDESLLSDLHLQQARGDEGPPSRGRHRLRFLDPL